MTYGGSFVRSKTFYFLHFQKVEQMKWNFSSFLPNGFTNMIVGDPFSLCEIWRIWSPFTLVPKARVIDWFTPRDLPSTSFFFKLVAGVDTILFHVPEKRINHWGDNWIFAYVRKQPPARQTSWQKSHIKPNRLSL